MKSLMIVLGLLVSCTFSYRITIECNDGGSTISSSGLTDLLSMVLGKGDDDGLGLGGGDDGLGLGGGDVGLGLGGGDLLGLVGGDEDGEDDDDVDDLSASLRELAKALQENKQTAEAETLNNAADVIDKLSEQMNKEVEGELKKGDSELEKELTNEVEKETQEEVNDQKEENKVLEQLDSTSPLP
ncbi:uncharacterized protein LOC121366620 [Gigantopelta aegis]|uniref:uncharacterized protein LOC121366620 n=1 Tax=Gigantopelta aegis TaxID=1735272 RepID=UPI001B88C8F3|nr:uncharacterized protein LOC121366620 [Gigantopelta aegis]